MYVHVDETFERDGVTNYTSGCDIWVDAPDTEDVRSQLLRFLEDPGNVSDEYPWFGENLVRVVVDELERLREPRAIPLLERFAQDLRREGKAWDGAQDAIARMQKAVRRPQGDRSFRLPATCPAGTGRWTG